MSGEQQQPCKVPDDPILNFIDFMGRYTILLNGTVLQKEATKGELQDLADEHKKEVIDKFKRLWESRPIANNGVSLAAAIVKEFYDAWEKGVLSDKKIVEEKANAVIAKLQPTAPRGGGTNAT